MNLAEQSPALLDRHRLGADNRPNRGLKLLLDGEIRPVGLVEHRTEPLWPTVFGQLLLTLDDGSRPPTHLI